MKTIVHPPENKGVDLSEIAGLLIAGAALRGSAKKRLCRAGAHHSLRRRRARFRRCAALR